MNKHIVFWLGRAPEPWDHQVAIEQGIGGSELAALRLTSELANLGHTVTVYADVLKPDAVTCNPRFLPYDDDSFSSALLTCDLLVSSRCPTLGLGASDRKKLGKPTWLWMHDLHVGADWGNTIGNCFDKVICLSKFAKDRFCLYYPKVSPHLVDIIPNGITMELYEPAGESLRAKHKRLQAGLEPLSVVWSSCPDRGLDRVLAVWPAIVKANPGAKLSVFGDFFNWARRCKHYGSEDQRAFAYRLTQRLYEVIEDPTLGVTYFGRAGQGMLANAFREAHLWLYPTSFEETSCITAMEAQAAYAKIVCTAVGALPETSPRARFLPAWSSRDSWNSQAVTMIMEVLKDDCEGSLELAREQLVSWKQVALIWDIQI